MKQNIFKLNQDVLLLNSFVSQMLISSNATQLDGAILDDLEALEVNLQELESFTGRVRVLAQKIEATTLDILTDLP